MASTVTGRDSTAWVRIAFAMFAVGWGANQFSPMLIVYRHELDLGTGAVAGLFLVYALAYLGFAAPYLVDGLGAVSGRTGAFGLLTAIIAVLALWTTGYAILSGRASPPASESDAPIGESRPVRQENSLLPNGQRRPVPGTHTLPG